MRGISQRGLDLIKRFEGLRTEAYLCPAGVWTIGFGSVGQHVHEGLVITEEHAHHLLRSDLLDAEDAVEDLAQVPLNDNEFAALVSLVFNIGRHAFKNSTLLRLLNQNNRHGARDQFERWCRVNGKPVKGLLKRRQAEARLFSEPVRGEA